MEYYLGTSQKKTKIIDAPANVARTKIDQPPSSGGTWFYASWRTEWGTKLRTWFDASLLARQEEDAFYDHMWCLVSHVRWVCEYVWCVMIDCHYSTMKTFSLSARKSALKNLAKKILFVGSLTTYAINTWMDNHMWNILNKLAYIHLLRDVLWLGLVFFFTDHRNSNMIYGGRGHTHLSHSHHLSLLSDFCVSYKYFYTEMAQTLNTTDTN